MLLTLPLKNRVKSMELNKTKDNYKNCQAERFRSRKSVKYQKLKAKHIKMWSEYQCYHFIKYNYFVIENQRCCN